MDRKEIHVGMGICKYLTTSEELKLRARDACSKDYATSGGHQQEPSSEAATEIASARSSQQILFSNRLSEIVPCLAPVELCDN